MVGFQVIMTKSLGILSSKTRKLQHAELFDPFKADIPPKYLCEIMADIMSDPVMFPQSRKVGLSERRQLR